MKGTNMANEATADGKSPNRDLRHRGAPIDGFGCLDTSEAQIVPSEQISPIRSPVIDRGEMVQHAYRQIVEDIPFGDVRCAAQNLIDGDKVIGDLTRELRGHHRRQNAAERAYEALKLELAVEIAKVAGLWDRVELAEQERDTARQSAILYRETLVKLRDHFAAGGMVGDAAALVKFELGRLLKPRYRVRTSPRFYSDEDFERAKVEVAEFANVIGIEGAPGWRAGVVGVVAKALGMRRAQS